MSGVLKEQKAVAGLTGIPWSLGPKRDDVTGAVEQRHLFVS